jgi:hypothetical protein
MIELLKQWLKALESMKETLAEHDEPTTFNEDEAITSLRQAIAELESQEPVAVYGYCPECGAKGVMRERRPDGNDKCAKGHTYPSSKATTAPQRTWVGLTDEERKQLWHDWENGHVVEATEAKLKEKNI